MGRRILEWGKSLLIALLVLSLLLLVLLTWVYDVRLLDNTTFTWLADMAASLGMRIEAPPEAHPLIEANFVPVATPTRLAITDEAGQTRGVAYDSAALEAVYNNILDPLGRALRGMEDPRPATRQQWLSALGEPHVYLSYPGSVPLNVLGVWLGGGSLYELDVSALALVRTNGSTRIYLRTANGYFAANTALPASDWTLPTDELPFCRYAFQVGWAQSLAADNLIFEFSPSIPMVRAGVAADLSSAEDKIMQVLHFSAGTHYQYPEDDGTRVFVDDTRTLRLTPDGTVIYRNPLETVQTTPMRSLAEYVELAAELARPAASASRNGQLQLLSATQSDEGRVTVTFGLSVCGAMVLYPSHDFMTEVIFEQGVISQAVCYLRQYQPTGESMSLLLPPRQVVQLLVGEPVKNIYLDVCYLDDTDDVLDANWYIR